MRFQTYNTKSYNMVTVIAEYSRTLLNFLNYPIAFDVFQYCLFALLEFISGNNVKNMDILVHHNTISICNSILLLEYHSNEDSKEAQKYIARNHLTLHESIMHSKMRSRKDSTLNLSAANKHDISHITIPLPKTNFMISMIKNKCAGILLEMISGLDPTHYIYYSFRRNLDPEMFKLNFAYQNYFIRNCHSNGYQTNLFLRDELDVNLRLKSPLIIETGFLLYFILMKMQLNLAIDVDENYMKIISLIPEKKKVYTTVSTNIFSEIYQLLKDIFLVSTSCCKKTRTTINVKKVNDDSMNDSRITKMLTFYTNNHSNVEINWNGTLVPYMFPKLPYCKFRSSKEKDKYLDQINFTNAKTKVDSLMAQNTQIISEIKVDYYLRNRITKCGGILTKYQGLWKNILSILIITLNFIILVSYTAEHGSRTSKPKLFELSIDNTKSLLTLLGIITQVFSLLVFINTVLINISVTYLVYRSENEQKIQLPSDANNSWLREQADKYISGFSDFLSSFVYKVVTDKLLIFHLALVIINLLGIIQHPFFYCYMMSFIILTSDTMLYLIHAVWEPKQSILLAIFLMFIIIYGFAVVAFWTYANDYSTGVCYSLWSCFLTSFDQTFKNDGGLAGYLEPAYEFQNNEVDIRYGRVIFDNLAFLLVALLLIEIISGIIIDKFGELRTNKKERQDNFNSECFI